MTLIADRAVPEAVYEQARQQFSEEELVKVMLALVVLNTWNRFAITFGDVPGSYEKLVRLVVPELQRRGLYRADYRGATLRENLALEKATRGDWRRASGWG